MPPPIRPNDGLTPFAPPEYGAEPMPADDPFSPSPPLDVKRGLGGVKNSALEISPPHDAVVAPQADELLARISAGASHANDPAQVAAQNGGDDPAAVHGKKNGKEDDSGPNWIEIPYGWNTGYRRFFQIGEPFEEDLRVRRKGVRSKADVDRALNYLVPRPSVSGQTCWLGVELDRLVRVFEKLSIPIKLGEKKLTYSYATPTFQGRVDRTSPNFGTEIVIRRGASVDVLLHEIIHTLPLSVIEKWLPMGDVTFPAVDPHLPFSRLRANILEHMRANEAISFAAQCYLYEWERRWGLSPILHDEMMQNLDGAWRERGLRGILDTFPRFLPHYEEREGLNSILLALVVKVEGTTRLTWEEEQTLTKFSDGSLPFEGYIRYLQKYLDRYVKENNLDLPPDFYSLTNIVRRAGNFQIQDFPAVVDGLFDSLEAVSDEKPAEPSVRRKEGKIEMPPASSRKGRERLFAAYTGVVDRVLSNPPADLTREELAAVVSYVRLVPPAEAVEIADRLRIYFGPPTADLQATLGLILYDKGFREKGESLVIRNFDAATMKELLPTVLKVMGPELTMTLLRNEKRKFLSLQQNNSDSFQTAALSEFNYIGDEWRPVLEPLFSHPEVLKRKEWHQFGLWLFEKGEVDTILEDDQILDLETENPICPFLEALLVLEGEKNLPKKVGQQISAVKKKIIENLKEAYGALYNLINLSGDESLLFFVAGNSKFLALFTTGEINEIFSSWPEGLRQKAVTLAQLGSHDPWIYPEAVLAVADDLYRAQKGEPDAKKKLFYLKRLRQVVDARISKGAAGLEPQEIANDRALAPFWKKGLGALSPQDYSEQELDDALFVPPDFYSPKMHLPLAVELFRWAETSAIEELAKENRISAVELAGILREVRLEVEGKEECYARALPLLQEFLRNPPGKYITDDIDIMRHINTALHPVAFYLFHHALAAGRLDLAEGFFDFLFRDIPQKYPPHTPYKHEGDQAPSSFGKEIYFLEHLSEQEWALAMAMERVKIRKEGGIDEWIERIQRELNRGGQTVTVGALDYFAGLFIDERNFGPLKALYRLMIQKSLMEPTEKNIRLTLKAIQESPLDDSVKDSLLEDFLSRLFDLIGSFRGIDLSLVEHLRGLFPWRTPFMRAGDIPHYPKTERLLLERLAEMPELVDPQKGKDDRVRLAAFAAAGLPLQRYADWMESRFDENQTSGAGSQRRGLKAAYRKLNLPHPYAIPAEYSKSEAELFLKGEGEKIKDVLAGGDAMEAQAVLQLLGRILGSELRWMMKEYSKYRTGEARFHETEGGYGLEPVDFSKSATVRFLVEWLQSRHQSEGRSPSVKEVQELLFTSGPAEIRRLDMASTMLEWDIPLDERREIFDQATRELVFSDRVKMRIMSFRNQNEPEKEVSFYKLLLKIHYSRHPGRMISDFLLEKMALDPGLLAEYEKALTGYPTSNLYLISELALTLLVDERDYLKDQLGRTNIDRLEFYLRALRFLETYLRHDREWVLANTSHGYIAFQRRIIHDHFSEFEPFLKEGFSMAEEYTYWDNPAEIQAMQEILAVAGWPARIGAIRKLKQLKPLLRGEIAGAEALLRRMIAEDLERKGSQEGLPDFVAQRQGLERDLLFWVFEALAPAEKQVLSGELEKAAADKERLLLLGRAAHLEKLLQLASIHPAVSEEYQEQFAVFQEEVPPRDPIDVKSTLDLLLVGEEDDFSVDLDNPLKEGTIGGVYRAVHRGRKIVVKVVPNGKERDLHESLRIVREVRRCLWATDYHQRGARAMDDLLVFYERTVLGELELLNELENSRLLPKILPAGFSVPEVFDLLTTPRTAAMEAVYSRRLKELSPDERTAVFRKIDDELIPAFLTSGVFHYDLHPGNIGVKEDGTIVLYDLGRVQQLSDAGRGRIGRLYALLGLSLAPEEKGVQLKALLREMGEVRDEEAYAGIDSLFEGLLSGQNPLKALEKVYPQLADYGFRLYDNYIKLLLMFLTWEGTKKSVESNGAPSAVPKVDPNLIGGKDSMALELPDPVAPWSEKEADLPPALHNPPRSPLTLRGENQGVELISEPFEASAGDAEEVQEWNAELAEGYEAVPEHLANSALDGYSSVMPAGLLGAGAFQMATQAPMVMRALAR